MTAVARAWLERMRWRVAAAAIAALLVARPASGQRGDSGTSRDTAARRVAGDSLYLRARRLVLEGNGEAGRALVDSVLATATGTPGYADALYWRAALAATAADAERDYRRVIVEYPFSPHAGDALLALAQLEMARGDRRPAVDHLQRFLLQRPNDPERVRAGIWLGRLLLEQNELPKGCAVLLRTRSSLGGDAIEIRNQIDYYAARCAGVDTGRRSNDARPLRDTTRDVAARRDTARGESTLRLDGYRYTVQVAAYENRAAAEQLVERLAARGIAARLAGTAAPFRVRVGAYATEAEAAVAARDLRAKGITVFVTTTDVERAPVRP